MTLSFDTQQHSFRLNCFDIFSFVQFHNFSKNEKCYFNCRRYEEEGENAWGCGSWFEYLIVIVLSTILLIGAVVLTLFWVIYYRGGFAWSENPKIQFNLHPVLMVGGFITLSGFCKLTTYNFIYSDQCNKNII